MLPPIHVVLVPVDSVVATLEDARAHLRGIALGERGGRARYVSLVSGPSRTADVEKTLRSEFTAPARST